MRILVAFSFVFSVSLSAMDYGTNEDLFQAAKAGDSRYNEKWISHIDFS